MLVENAGLSSDAFIDIGSLSGSGSIEIDDDCDGDIIVAAGTGSSTLIHLAGGLDSNGSVTTNDTGGDYNAAGSIVVGTLSGNPVGGNYDGDTNLLKEYGIEPAPQRSKRTPWRTFLKAHWECVAAADFFTVEVWKAHGLVRYFVLFFLDPTGALRRDHPASAW